VNQRHVNHYEPEEVMSNTMPAEYFEKAFGISSQSGEFLNINLTHGWINTWK